MSFEADLLNEMTFLKSFARKLTKNYIEAEDLVQDILVRALHYKDKYEEGTNLRGWLGTIMRNQFYSSLRKNRPVNDTDDIFQSTMSVNPNQEIVIQFREFEAIFDKMEEIHRRSLELVCIQGMTYEEAAEIEGVALGTMKSRVSRARTQLKEAMGYIDTDEVSTAVRTRNDNIRASYC